ncbi:alpha/beta-hydrolase [Trametes coccinea BRFM310]|uniref:Alpha/beta-hydrolase n=1 Tax=Trametes coccinea (strain BRFM310) TaxID=1353009 RepID=A0A1Y2I5Q8_TRAC3|nr:alpha/beta-hydrolase [Trametes coccinea BRFM310]
MACNHLSEPNSELAPILASLPAPPPTFTEDLVAAREYFDTQFIEIARNFLRPTLPGATEYVTEYHKIPVEGGEVAVRCYRPCAPEAATFPLFFWVHRGGWVFGNLEQDDYRLKVLAVELQVAIVAADYRLAPEYPFPTGLNDTWAILKWSVQNARRIKADASKALIIGGQSAGATYAAALVQRTVRDHTFVQHRITGQLLQIPPLLHPDATPDELKDKMTSYVQNATSSPILWSSHMRDYYDKLQGSPSDPDLSPLLQPSFEGLPPTYLQICGGDPTRDDGLVYAEKLQAAGIPTKLDVYPGAPHGFHLVFPQTEMALKFNQDFTTGLRWLLEGASTNV